MVKFLIYGLFDPRTEELRYVGKSCSGLERPRQHIKPRLLKARTHKNSWLKSLLSEGLRPEIDVLEEHAGPETLNEAERFFIAYFRGIGCRLTNGTDGGDGVSAGRIQSLEEKAKRSASLMGHVGYWKGKTKGLPKPKKVKLRKPVRDDAGVEYPSGRAAAIALGLHPGNVCSVLKGRLKTTGGRKFFYV